MNDTNPPSEHTPPRPKRRILVRLLRGFLVLVVLLIVTYLIADQILLRKVQRQRELFKERFGAVDFRDFIPERPKPEEDAGRVYLYAAGLMAKVDEEYGDWSMYDALTKGPEAFATRGRSSEPLPTREEADAKVREKMAAMDEAFRVVEKAQALTRGSVVQDYNFEENQRQELADVRQVARNVAAKAVFEARAGNLDAASAWLESGMHLASTMEEEPSLIVQLVRIAVAHLATEAAEQTFNATDTPLTLSEHYWALLNRISDPKVYRRGMASEAGYAMSQAIPMPVPMPRLVWSLNELNVMAFYSTLDSALGADSISQRRALLDALAQKEVGTVSITNLVAIAAPGVVRGIDSYDRLSARCEFIRLAAALRAFKQQKGAYPDSLEGLAASAQSPATLDPFSCEAYHYLRDGEGFLLYSVGPDRKDDGGVKGERGSGDVVWTCVR